MVSIAYVLPGVGLTDAERGRREGIANELTSATVSVVEVERGPLSIESEVEHEWSVGGLLKLIEEEKDAYDGFVIGCFGDPGLTAARELTTKPVIGPASATFHTAAQLADCFSCLTVRSTPASKRRQIYNEHLGSRLASVRVVDLGVLDVDHGSESVVSTMVQEAHNAVEEDGAEAVIPGCMSLAFMQVHDEVAAELGVPFLDPVSISLETAAMWARHGINHSRLTYPPFDASRYDTLFE